MVEKKYVMSIDQGTTGTRVMLFTHNGLPVKGGWSYHCLLYTSDAADE